MKYQIPPPAVVATTIKKRQNKMNLLGVEKEIALLLNINKILRASHTERQVQQHDLLIKIDQSETPTNNDNGKKNFKLC